MIAYVTPAVALGLGLVVRHEPIGPWTLAGLWTILPSDPMSDALHCRGCQKHLPAEARQAGTLCISAQGDERILSWWLCDACGVYTRKEYVDRFHGDPDEYSYGPFPREAGDADLARVAKCPAWDDKWCNCETHKHFGSS